MVGPMFSTDSDPNNFPSARTRGVHRLRLDPTIPNLQLIRYCFGTDLSGGRTYYRSFQLPASSFQLPTPACQLPPPPIRPLSSDGAAAERTPGVHAAADRGGPAIPASHPPCPRPNRVASCCGCGRRDWRRRCRGGWLSERDAFQAENLPKIARLGYLSRASTIVTSFCFCSFVVVREQEVTGSILGPRTAELPGEWKLGCRKLVAGSWVDYLETWTQI